MFLAYCSQFAMAGGWGPTFAIELRGDGLEHPIEITDPSILEKLSFWVGPGTNMRDFMRSDGSEKSIVNWDTGVVTERPSGLQRVEVKFRVGWSPESTVAFFVLYEMEPGSSTAYIYHPITNNAIVAHVDEGAWRYRLGPVERDDRSHYRQTHDRRRQRRILVPSAGIRSR